MDLAASSVRRKASTLAMSGLAAPARTTMPTCERQLHLAAGVHQASQVELVGGASVQDHHVRRLTARETRRNRLRKSPIEGPRVVTSR